MLHFVRGKDNDDKKHSSLRLAVIPFLVTFCFSLGMLVQAQNSKQKVSPKVSSEKIPEPSKPDSLPPATMTLSEAIKANNIEQVKRNIDRGTPLNRQNQAGLTPLHQALLEGRNRKGQPKIVAMLVKAGANVESKNKDGLTPLHWATTLTDHEAIKVLLDAGANVESKNKNGWTPLYSAMFSGNPKLIKVLLAAGANVESGSSNTSPLHMAATLGQTEAIKVLLDAGANVESKNEKGWTPLHWATLSGKTEAIKVLLDAGANVESKDKGGSTPLHWATFSGKTEAIKVLLDAGANRNARNSKGITPVEVAKNRSVQSLLQSYRSKDSKQLARIQESNSTLVFYNPSFNGNLQIEPVLKYEIVEGEDLSIGNARRFQVRVSLPQHYSKKSVKNIARAIIRNVVEAAPVNAISILFYGPGTVTDGVYDVAKVDWAPEGRWGKALSVKAGDYSTFDYSISYKSPEKVYPNKLQSAGRKGLLGVPLPKGATLIEKQSGNPANGVDPSEKYAVTSIADIASFYKEEMPKAGWSKGGASTKTVLFFHRGNLIISVIIDNAKKTFTLMGS